MAADLQALAERLAGEHQNRWCTLASLDTPGRCICGRGSRVATILAALSQVRDEAQRELQPAITQGAREQRSLEKRIVERDNQLAEKDAEIARQWTAVRLARDSEEQQRVRAEQAEAASDAFQQRLGEVERERDLFLQHGESHRRDYGALANKLDDADRRVAELEECERQLRERLRETEQDEKVRVKALMHGQSLAQQRVTALEAQLRDTEAERDRRLLPSDYCSYCGFLEEYASLEDKAQRSPGVAAAHLAACPERPERALQARVTVLEGAARGFLAAFDGTGFFRQELAALRAAVGAPREPDPRSR